MASGGAASQPFFRYMSAWFCPFAHRCTIALEHHSERVKYEWVEALGWEQRPNEDGTTGQGHEWWYHWKSEELMQHNPNGLVPTLVEAAAPGSGAPEPQHPRAAMESLVTVEFVDAISGATGKQRLISEDLWEAARARVWADRVNKECCSPYYTVLVRTEDGERMEGFQALLAGLRAFDSELQKTPGPTFLADAQLSNVDISLIPWAYRFYVFEHYRGERYTLQRSDPTLQRYWAWFDHVMALPQVARTLPGKDRYLAHIKKYADSSARSKVANAVRRGVSAHEYDDKKDEY